MARPTSGRNVHELDLLAQELYDGLEGDIAFLAEMISGPTPVGTRYVPPKQWPRRLLKMAPQEFAEFMGRLPDKTPVMANALDQLGAHALALLPYLQPGPLTASPQSASAPEEEVF